VIKAVKKAQKHHILIVEDEQLLNDAYGTILERQGFSVASVYNGEEALVEMKRQTPDLVLLDLRMPKMNGVEFLKAVQLKKNYPKSKVVVFSNYDVQKDIDEAFKLGATRYMLKAWASPKELVKLVQDMLGVKPAKTKAKA
jgi:DNA-binding NarL/FixJ family response regulator